MRMEVIRLQRGTTLINDAYNANPYSTELALETLAGAKGEGRAIAVLGDMLELGSFSKEAHEQIGKRVSELSIDFLLTLGRIVHGHRVSNSSWVSGEACKEGGESFRGYLSAQGDDSKRRLDIDQGFKEDGHGKDRRRSGRGEGLRNVYIISFIPFMSFFPSSMSSGISLSGRSIRSSPHFSFVLSSDHG